MRTSSSAGRPRRRRPATIAAIVFSFVAFARANAVEPVSTFSIVGYDPVTGELGVAVQSRFFAVGSVVPWARAGVGAIATQSFANTTFGPNGLRLLEEGHAPDEVIRLLTESDEQRDQRQIGIVDAKGRSAAYTGSACMTWAGHVSGPNYTAQGNILAGEPVVRAMAAAFEETQGSLGEKLVSAIEAGQSKGGDSRGVQSAAILIVKEGAGYGGYNDRYCDLRVDDHTDPIGELRRIFDLWQWNALVFDGYTLCDRSRWDEAFAKGQALIDRNPTEGESYYHLACFYSKAHREEDALATLREATRRDPSLGPRAKLDPDFAPLLGDPRFVEITSQTPVRWAAAW